MSRRLCIDQNMLPWLVSYMNASPAWTNKAVVIAELEDEIPIAVCLFDNFNGRSIYCHVWIAKGKIPTRVWYWACHDYPFWQCGITNVVFPISADNKKAIKLCKHVGGREVARIPDFYRTGEDQLIFVATEETTEHWNRYDNGRLPGPIYSRMKETA